MQMMTPVVHMKADAQYMAMCLMVIEVCQHDLWHDALINLLHQLSVM